MKCHYKLVLLLQLQHHVFIEKFREAETAREKKTAVLSFLTFQYLTIFYFYSAY